jgi:methanol---5-hydroxybenzimidazolylcobamide Co-methyltransferase
MMSQPNTSAARASHAAARLAVEKPEDLLFGRAPKPVMCGFGLTIGAGQVYPEINFTLPPMLVEEGTWKQVRANYEEIATAVTRRAEALRLPGLVVELEQLPPMTQHPQWGAQITALLHGHLKRLHESTGMPVALRVTVVDLRDARRPPVLREGPEWEAMREALVTAAQAGAHILSIESVGGKEVHDEALLYGNLNGIVFALGSLGCRDMAWLWREITAIADRYGVISGGDSACGFANTAMQLAGQGMLPAVLAAIVRAASSPRSLAAFESGAVGPSKDCAYEGPVMKAITGCPISMEGKSASCAHFSPLGNIAGAAADLWSNESVQNVRLLSGSAPEAFLELLAYDCRLFNVAAASGDALRLRDWLVASDLPFSVEALMLDPEVVLDLARAIVRVEGGYARTVAAVHVACEAMNKAINAGRIALDERESRWLKQLSEAADTLPATEEEALADAAEELGHLYHPYAYGL